MANCICIPTIAAASGSGVIPSGTPAVVIEQFDTTSDVSAALYVPTGLITAPPTFSISRTEPPTGSYIPTM